MTVAPHTHAKADRRVGRAAVVGDPWAANIRRAVLKACHRWQRDAIVDPSRRISILTGRGGGKTTMYKGRYLVEMAETTKGKFIYACPTLGMAIELLWEPLKQTCEQLGIMDDCTWLEAPRQGGKILIFNRTGSQLKLFGADDKKQINLCRGQPFNGVACDEVAFWPSVEVVGDFVEKVIEPRIGERDGWIGLASSPGHVLRGMFCDVTSDGSSTHRPYSKREEFPGWELEQWSSHAWSLRDVVEEPKANEIYPALVALRRSHVRIKKVKGWRDDHPTWMREYEGRWAKDGTTMVFQFDDALNLWAPQRFDVRTETFRDGALPQIEGLQLLKLAIAALPKSLEWHFVLIGDKGSPRAAEKDEHGEAKREGDPFAWNVFAFAPADRQRRMLHAFYLEKTGMYARTIAQLCLGADDKGMNGCMSHEKPGGLFEIIGWPDAMVMDADAALIAELSNTYGLRFEKAEKKPDYKAGAIELANGDLITGAIKALEGSPLHRQMTGLQWAEQESGALREDPSQPNHSSDCMIYGHRAVAKLYESGAVNEEDGGNNDRGGPARSPAPANYSDPMGLDDDRTGADDAFDSWTTNATDDWGL